MGIRLSSFLDAATQKESKRGEKPGRTRVLPALGRVQVRSTKAERANRPLRGATRTGGKHARQVHLGYRTKLLFILPLITLMEVPL